VALSQSPGNTRKLLVMFFTPEKQGEQINPGRAAKLNIITEEVAKGLCSWGEGNGTGRGDPNQSTALLTTFYSPTKKTEIFQW